MAKLITFVLFCSMLALGSCQEHHTYPLSNDACHETDPVQDLRPLDCVPKG